jgi:hypothetical protein
MTFLFLCFGYCYFNMGLRWFVNDKLEMVLKEAVLTYFKVPTNFLEELKKISKKILPPVYYSNPCRPEYERILLGHLSTTFGEMTLRYRP